MQPYQERMEDGANLFAALPDIAREPRHAVLVLASKVVAPQTIVLSFKKPKDFHFKAGQYVWIVLPERTAQHGVVDRRAYSLSSAADAPHLECYIRVTGSEYTLALSALKEGQTVELIGPMGSEFVPPPEGAVMLSGGVGIAPFLSVLRSRLPGRFSLYAFEDAGRPLYCKDELHALPAAERDIHITSGRLNPKHLAELASQPRTRPIYISGPQGFVDAAADALRSCGVDESLMHFEAYYPSLKENFVELRGFEHISDIGEVDGQIENAGMADSARDERATVELFRWSKETMIDWIIWLIFGTAILSGVELLWQERALSWVHIGILSSFFVLMVWRRFRGSAYVASQVIIAAVFAALLYSRTDNSFSSLLEPWRLIFPVLARKLLSFRAALLWNTAFIAALAGVSVLGDLGLFGVPPFEDSIYQFIIAILFLSVLTGLYSYREERNDALLRKNMKVRQDLIAAMDEALHLSSMFVKISSQTSNHVILTNKDGRVLYANRAAEELTGYTFKEMRGQTPRLWGGLMSPEEYERIWTEKSHGRKVMHTIINRRRNGSLYVALGRITPIMKDGVVIAYVATEEDVTSFVNLDKTKSEFVSLASHQLRTPLSAVNWYAEMLLSGDAGKLTVKQKKFIDEIYEGNQRMVDLVNALLNVSRIDLGTFIIDPEPTDLSVLLQDVVKEQQPAIDQKRLALTVSSDSIPKADVDPKLLRMVFQNLLSNAVKYTPERGSIDLGLTVKRSGESLGGKSVREDSLCFSVKDSGYGIPADQQRLVFTKLFRADNVREKDTTGTGLGLYIVNSIADHAGGAVWFESRENKGTTFWFTLPLAGMKKRGGTRQLN